MGGRGSKLGKIWSHVVVEYPLTAGTPPARMWTGPRPSFLPEMLTLFQLTEVRFVSFLSGESITAIVVNPPERKLAAKRTSVQLGGSH